MGVVADVVELAPPTELPPPPIPTTEGVFSVYLVAGGAGGFSA